MKLLYLIIALFTAVVGLEIHGNWFWCIVDFFFWPYIWLKWLVLHEVNVSIIKAAFSSFLS